MQNRGYSDNIELVNIATKVSAEFTFANATSIFTSNGHGFRDGDAVLLSNAGGALPDGLLSTTKYYVQVIDANTFYLYTDSALSTLATAADDGSGTNSFTLQARVMNVVDYRNIILDVDTANSAAMTIKVVGSSIQSCPNFSAAQSASNVYKYILIKDIESGTAIEGDTGIVLAGTDINKQYEVNVNGLSWITVIFSSVTAGNAQIIATAYDNN